MTNHTPTDTLGIVRRTFNPERLIGVRPPIQCLKIIFPPSYTSSGPLHIRAWGDPGSFENEPHAVPQIALDIRISTNNGLFSTGPSPVMFWDIMFWDTLPLAGLHTLSITQWHFKKLAWLELCGRLEHLTTLKLNGLGKSSATKILKILSSARTIGQGHEQKCEKPLPQYFHALRELSISEWDFETMPDDEQTSKLLKRLIECLRTRKEMGAGIKAIGIRNCRYLFESGVEELRNVVPHVTWDRLEEWTESEDNEDEDEDEYDEYYGRGSIRGYHH